VTEWNWQRKRRGTFLPSHKQTRRRRRQNKRLLTSFLAPSVVFRDLVIKTAAKKRQMEELVHGLIITRAVWETKGDADDKDKNLFLRDLLQYWVVDSHLQQRTDTLFLFSREGQRITKALRRSAVVTGPSWWSRPVHLIHSWLSRSWSTTQTIATPDDVWSPFSADLILLIRYRYRNQVFEIRYPMIETVASDGKPSPPILQLPHPGATLLGDAQRVA